MVKSKKRYLKTPVFRDVFKPLGTKKDLVLSITRGE